MMRRSLMVIFLLALPAAQARAEEGRAVGTQSLPFFETQLEAAELVLARPFALCVVGRHHNDTRVVWPEALALGDAFEEGTRSQSSEALGGGLVRSELCVDVMLFDTAIREIPAIAIAYDLGTGETLLRRTAALPVKIAEQVRGANAALRPPAEPVDVPIRDWRIVALALGLGAGLVLLAARIAWRRRRSDRTQRSLAAHASAATSPHEEALARLSALESSGALDADQLKPCYLDMSEIFRSYLGRRFGFTALDLTTAEIRSRLARVSGSDEWLNAAMRWLSRCDLVKYANTAADPDEAREALYAARVLIDRTKDAEGEELREVTRA